MKSARECWTDFGSQKYSIQLLALYNMVPQYRSLGTQFFRFWALMFVLYIYNTSSYTPTKVIHSTINALYILQCTIPYISPVNGDFMRYHIFHISGTAMISEMAMAGISMAPSTTSFNQIRISLPQLGGFIMNSRNKQLLLTSEGSPWFWQNCQMGSGGVLSNQKIYCRFWAMSMYMQLLWT